MIEDKKKELQSATFERLLKHLDERKDVQNIDLMNLAGFCRNCLSRWYREEAEKKGLIISDLVKNLLPVPLSNENIPPIPLMQSIIKSVFFQASC